MKIALINFTKETVGIYTRLQYPDGYDINTIEPFIYGNIGASEEQLLAIVPDNFAFTPDFVEKSLEEAETLIESLVNGNIAIDEDNKSGIIVSQKAYLTKKLSGQVQ